MVIAQLTHLRIAIPSSGTPPGEVPSDCFPKTTAPAVTKRPRRVTFSPEIQSTMEEIDLLITDQDEAPADSPMITIIEENEQTKAQETKEESIMPPPGFRPFQWPHAEWEQTGDATLDPGLDFVASWSARIMEERSSTPPLLPLSPIIADDSQDSIVVQVGSPATGKYKPTGLDQIRSVPRRRPRRPMKGATQCEKPAPAEDFLSSSNLDILDQYAFALHGTASKILEKTIGGSPYPSSSRGAGPASTSSFGSHGGTGPLEALPGSDAVRQAIL